ncbi:SDR family oxidoreductase [Reichenbachiella sp. MSK19-1]|uniref:SDR family oxidoreductase n=1 Tax=Reichenbachiella sp. MSK19-1 TaxID=1897631 RepID=UPI000E6D15D7|nr:SDR family oxidoreductase [Reichenbachiella sp. MSK19-1]RJE71564.1 hypothetical protein BGP76_05580 [Reichenbachiella sp. MSK19-1]
MNQQQVIFITGASSGIGQSCFDYLFGKGHRVYGTSRRPSGDNPFLLKMDVTKPKSIAAAVQTVIDKEGRIDVLINNAGISVIGPAELTHPDDARQQLETNFWGVVNTNNAILPHMRQQKSGKIIHISSVMGLFAIPNQAYYAASKHALEGYAEALRMELHPTNIQVALIQPGDFMTEISQNRILSIADDSTEYQPGYNRALEVIVKGERNGDNPIKVAKLIHRIIQKPKLKLRYAIGKPLDLLAAKLKPILPQRLFQWIIMDHFRQNR